MQGTVRIDLGRAALVLLIVVAIAGGGYGAKVYTEGLPPFGPSDDAWSGVFLTNGQAYFGHLYSGPGDYAILRDVYYVLAQQLQSQDPKAAPATQLSLQRLGGEVHGPRGEMRISKQQILFVEELRPDSPLVQAIFQLKAAPPVPAQPAPAQPTPAASASPSPSPVPPTPSVTPAPSASPTRSPAPSPTR